MSTDALNRFRHGLARGDFTMTEIAEATGIPLTTLSDMKDANWRPKVLDRLDSLATVLDRIDGKTRRPSKHKRREAGAAA